MKIFVDGQTYVRTDGHTFKASFIRSSESTYKLKPGLVTS